MRGLIEYRAANCIAIGATTATPASRTNRLAGKPSKMLSALRPPTVVPIRKAATKPMIPRLIGKTVPTMNMTTSTIIEIISGPIKYLRHGVRPLVLRCRAGTVFEVARLLRPHHLDKLSDNLVVPRSSLLTHLRQY